VSTWAQVQDVEDAWTRPFTPSEVRNVGRLLDRAEREVARHVDVAARILAGVITLEDVQDALVDIVTRKLRNSGGIRSQTSGPFSQVIDQSVASGRIEITQDDRRKLGMITSSGTVATYDPAIRRPIRHVQSLQGYVPREILP
jgi:hypothetical protein